VVPTTPAPVPVVQAPAPAADPEVAEPKAGGKSNYSSFLVNGGYIVANVGGISRHLSDFGYLWGFDGGGWIALSKPLSLGIGVKIENEPSFKLWRYGVPFRLSVNSGYFSIYGIFTPGIARAEACHPDVDPYWEDCAKKRNGLDLQLGMGLMFLLGRGFILGFEPSFNHSYWYFDTGEYESIDVQDSAFTFRTWLGWKFGKGTID
jgi:hypothetical protein